MSVASGVKTETFGFELSSFAVDSLLCAFENAGYELAFDSPRDDLRSISGTDMVTFFARRARSDMDERPSLVASLSLVWSFSLLVDLRLEDLLGVLTRSLSLDRGLSVSRSFFRRDDSSLIPKTMSVQRDRMSFPGNS